MFVEIIDRITVDSYFEKVFIETDFTGENCELVCRLYGDGSIELLSLEALFLRDGDWVTDLINENIVEDLVSYLENNI